MFLELVNRRNRNLIDVTFDLHQKGILEPDSYIIDMDVLRDNAKMILNEANKHSIDLYFMMKQLGRNPLIAQELVEMGYRGAVVVDYREADVMMQHNIPLGNVGHLVQTPKHNLKRLIRYGVEVFTVFSIEKLQEINEIAHELGIMQDVILKVSSNDDLYYSGQMSGIDLNELQSFIKFTERFSNIRIVGATAFPCYLYDVKEGITKQTENYNTVISAVETMKQSGINVLQVNVPSTTCVSTLKVIAEGMGNMGEPGHGLSGTTPAHAYEDLEERPAVVYLSEISHNFRGKSYAYGGGHYRRSHVKNAMVNDGHKELVTLVKPVNNDSIDYYFELDNPQVISASVIMAFRFQIFVTRSKVVLIEGIQSLQPSILGVYDSVGKLYE